MGKPGLKRIVVAVKPRGHGAALPLERARLLARAFDAEVALAGCVHDALIAFGLAGRAEAARAAQQRLIERERERLEGLAQPLRASGVRVEVRALWHTPVYEGILRAVHEWEADLLVVGAHEPRPVPHTVLLDTDWQLIRLCPCPLLLVKAKAGEPYSTVLAAVDPLHRHAEPDGLDNLVLDAARTLSRALGARLRAVHAYPDPARFALARAIEVEPGLWYGTDDIENAHRRALTELVSYHGVTVDEIDFSAGDAVPVITEVVEQRHVDLLVVGALKRGVLRQATLGSTAEWLAAEAACDVLLVKPP
jgi:universal stress protein E